MSRPGKKRKGWLVSLRGKLACPREEKFAPAGGKTSRDDCRPGRENLALSLHRSVRIGRAEQRG